MSETVYSCTRCGHNWSPHHAKDTYRYGIKPKRCAGCRSLNWERGYLSHRNCPGICKRFINQLKKDAKRPIVGSKNAYLDYRFCKMCRVYMKQTLIFKSKECPCCKGWVRMKARKKDEKL